MMLNIFEMKIKHITGVKAGNKTNVEMRGRAERIFQILS